MFTGVIKVTGKVQEVRRNESGMTLEIVVPSRLGRTIEKGGSVALNGVCLSVTKIAMRDASRQFKFDVIPETLNRTNLGLLKQGDTVHLELPLRHGEEIHGHLVSGHVDAVTRVISKKKSSRGILLTCSTPQNLLPFLAEKGSVALDGVSLTIVRSNKKTFSAALIPLTEKLTHLGMLKKGDLVNVEVDCVARYLTHQARYGGNIKTRRSGEKTRRIAILAATFHRELAMNLVAGAKEALKTHGISQKNIDLHTISGSFELPFLAARLAKTNIYKGMIALGVVIKGETDHHRFITEGAATGLQRAASEANIPITFGIVTADTRAQAEARAEIMPKKIMRNGKIAFSNKGFEAASALAELLAIFENFTTLKKTR